MSELIAHVALTADLDDGSESDRFRLGPIENPVRGVLQGGAATGALLLLGRMLASESSVPYPVAITFFALTQATLYMTSTLYHTVPWRPAAKQRMQRLDHAMIDVAVAGTVTAVVLLSVVGPLRVGLIAATWLIAAAGAAIKFCMRSPDTRVTVPMQVLLGCLALPAFPAFAQRFPGVPATLLVVGAVSFALGTVCFVTRSPRLWPRVFSFHEVFHLCTVVGSGAHCTLFAGYLWQVG